MKAKENPNIKIERELKLWKKKLTKDILKIGCSNIFGNLTYNALLGFGDILVLGLYADNAAIAVNTANQPI